MALWPKAPINKRTDKSMTAYVIVEASLLDAAARDSYAEKARPILKQFGAEFLAFGPWHVFHGEPAYDNGMIIAFPDRETALAWYNAPEYQALLKVRDKGLDSRFRLIG
jgi:uncharacterized protein (DUF1330 family)